MAPQDVVHPMDPRYLRTFLSKSMVNSKTIDCVISALKKYNKAVNDAGKDLERDLKKCQNSPVRVRKPPLEKKI
jgi:hypothetical protein